MNGESELALRDTKDGFAIYQLKDAPGLRMLRFASLAELRADARQMRSRVHAVVEKAENMLFGSKADAEQFLRTEGFTVVPSEEPDVISVLSSTRMSANICLDYGVDCCLVDGCNTRGLDQPVSRGNYLLTYAGSLPDSVLHLGQPEAMLESLFSRFNTERPQDFRGHSLSVSDVIALKLNGQVTCYYTDSFGFEKLPDFLSRDELSRENYLHNAEMLLEDDYNMLDGIVNNGPREGGSQAPEKQQSVSDREATDTPHTHPKALVSKEPER